MPAPTLGPSSLVGARRRSAGGAEPGLDKLWRRACVAADIKGLHFHDLRHRGNTLAAANGASTRELMTRMGHSTACAALIHRHATAERGRLIGNAVRAAVEQARKQDPDSNGHAAGA